jgi:hypothetical protein
VSPFDLHNFGDYFIIESPTRGTFREWDYSEDKPRFAISGSRADAEKAHRFTTLKEAEEMLDKIGKKVRQNNCYIADARYGFEKVGTIEHKYMVRGSTYEPGEFSGSDGYIRFWDIIQATSPEKAKKMAEEDYGDYNHIEVVGIAKDKAQEEHWLRKNDS